MKEELLKRLFSVCTQYDAQLTFLLGMMFCIILLLFIFLLLVLIRFAFREGKKIDGITLAAGNGDVFIAAPAIADAVRAVCKADFRELEITKVKLLKIKNINTLRVTVSYRLSDQSMLDIANGFQERVLEVLKTTFGIENIQKIDLLVPKGKL